MKSGIGVRKLTVLKSELDASVNFVRGHEVGFYESRYVRRTDDYFIAYLSAQTGCNRGCGFCHLTTSGQTKYVDATKWDLIQQLDSVIRHYKTQKPAKYMHVNFMARGEVLANKHIVESGHEMLETLGSLCTHVGNVPARFNVSTIMPRTLKKSLVDIFQYMQPTMYYSFYSTDSAFRKKWMPGAMATDGALRMLKEYQDFSQKRTKIHFALINGENDHVKNMDNITEALQDHGIMADINIVRYNPADESSSETPESAIQYLAGYLRNYWNVQVVTRVGLDVHASCGTFFQDENT